ncbi:MAG TPA: GNAT family N-acetyltransferase [Azospirillaceae bacterium]|nr:GNAT family N-acetyltransferase [Azospirillaceae bacterium]
MINVAQPDVRLREMAKDDIAQAHELSRALQWPHRPEDWEFLLQHGSGVVAERDGEVVGTAMGWPYGADAATLGMVIVSHTCQGAGVGRKLMNGVLDRLGDRTVMLNATDEGIALYERMGFVRYGTILQHQGAAFSVPLTELLPDERVRPLGARDDVTVRELDRRATGMDRSGLIGSLLDVSQGVVLTRGHEPAGFSLFRRFGRGYVVGPTVAPDIGGAKALISHWLGSNAGMFCRVDVPEDSGLSGWLDDLGLQCVGRVTRMVRGPALPRDPSLKTFSLVNQALG